LVLRLAWLQPTVSKHLGVLRDVGLVRAERRNREKVYEMNADPLKPVHDWTTVFRRLWGRQLQQIKAHAEAKARAANVSPSNKKETDRHE
jgi:DNA-binding transcriptional ArsR family regulator